MSLKDSLHLDWVWWVHRWGQKRGLILIIRIIADMVCRMDKLVCFFARFVVSWVVQAIVWSCWWCQNWLSWTCQSGSCWHRGWVCCLERLSPTETSDNAWNLIVGHLLEELPLLVKSHLLLFFRSQWNLWIVFRELWQVINDVFMTENKDKLLLALLKRSTVAQIHKARGCHSEQCRQIYS